MREPGTGPSTIGLISDTLARLLSILRGEIALAKAEMRESVSGIGQAVALIAVAAVIAVVGLNLLAGALVLALVAAGLPQGAAALVVGLALVGLAAILFFIARARLQAASQAPRRMASSLRKDAGAVTGEKHDV